MQDHFAARAPPATRREFYPSIFGDLSTARRITLDTHDTYDTIMAMITTVRRSGNSFIIRVPREEMERIGIQEGEHVSVEIRALDVRPRLPNDLRASVDAEIPLSKQAFDRLANA
jgi:antitoxin component of MazEF toxin-antitoxin module